MNVKIHILFQILWSEQDVERSLVLLLATKKAMAPLANNPIMSGRLIQLFRHLSTGDDYIDISGIFYSVPILATKEALVPLAHEPIML